MFYSILLSLYYYLRACVQPYFPHQTVFSIDICDTIFAIDELNQQLFSCKYATYWKYGEKNFNNFPSHWWFNGSSYNITNYMNFKCDMSNDR